MNCVINIDYEKNPALKGLRDYCGANQTLFYEYFVNVIDNYNDGTQVFRFKKEFIDSWSHKTPLNIQDGSKGFTNLLTRSIIKYYKEHNASVSDSTRVANTVNKIVLYGYDSVEAREEAKRHFANQMYIAYNKALQSGDDKTKHYKNVYIREALLTFRKSLTNQLANLLGKTTKEEKLEIYNNLVNNCGDYITKLTKDVLIPLQTQNLIALYVEATTVILNEDGTVDETQTSPRDEFLNEVFNDSRINEIRFTIAKTEEEQQEEKALQEENADNADFDDDTTGTESSFDDSIRILTNKMGEYTSYLTHVDGEVKAVLGSLIKLKSNKKIGNKPDYDKDNHLGIPDVMDVDSCASMLYHFGEFDTIDAMIESIVKIAEQKPGFEAFFTLAEMLRNNQNLAYKFHSTFGKMVIEKLETVVENGEVVNRISNGSGNKQSKLVYDYVNSLKSTTVESHGGVNSAFMNKELLKLQLDIKDYKQNEDVDGTKAREYAVKIANLLKQYYSTVDEISVRNYVLNNTPDYKLNIQRLLSILQRTIKGAKVSNDSYMQNRAEVAYATRHNNAIKRRRANLEAMGVAATDANVGTPIDVSAIYVKKFISPDCEGAAIDLAKELLPYTVVDSPLNSKNALGNQSSNVINSSMITSIIHHLQSSLNTQNEQGIFTEDSPIMRLAQHKFKTQQYELSNILLEHRENGQIINYGIFRKVVDATGNVTYVPTEYAANLLQSRLFNGASNTDNSTNVLYKGMSKGDYIGTSWINFFNSGNTIERVAASADYFMRIPSDAPKTFTITAPRYSAEGLINSENLDKLVTTTVEKINDTTTDRSGLLNRVPIVTGTSRYSTSKIVASHLMSTETRPVNIRISDRNQKNLRSDSTKRVRMLFRYNTSDNQFLKDENLYVMEGIYHDGVLHNAVFKGFVGESINDNMWATIRPQVEIILDEQSSIESNVKRTINRNHPLFKQMYQSFVQELIDMAVAGDVIFETEEVDGKLGLAKTDRGVPKLKKGRTNRSHNGLHPVYHFSDPDGDGTGAIYVRNDDGSYSLTGRVFESDRFILYDDLSEDDHTRKPIRNYGNEILKEAFDLFNYDNSRGNRRLLFTKDKNGNIVLSINPEQRAIIESKLSEFMLDSIEHSRTRLNEYKGFIKGASLSTSNIAEYIFNHRLMYIAFGDLYEGNSKFYKNAQTFLKRAKESQASGVPYGIVDFTRPIQGNHQQIASPLDNTSFEIVRTVNGEVIREPKQVKAYDSFRAITIYNTTKTDIPLFESLVSTLTNKNIMGKSVLSEDEARKLLYGNIKLDKLGRPIIDRTTGKPKRTGGYQDSVVNDAQSYITFDEWVRRITARGQLPKYKNLIDKILDETQELTIDDIKEFVQVQKNFYYDQYYNDELKTISPRQIKNAEFVLVPRFIKGTELEVVSKFMDKFGIDQLNTAETSKAGQNYILSIWDNDGNMSEDLIKDADRTNPKEYKSSFAKALRDNKKIVEDYNYNYLYTQQETPQHVHDKNKAGIQILKKILDNIDDNSSEELKEAKREFFELYAANIEDSALSLFEELGIELDDNGNIQIQDGRIKGLDYEKLYDKLKNELIRLGLDSNMAAYCTLSGVTKGDTLMANYMPLVAKKFENIVQSVFNNAITRQTLPGFHAVQVTNVGFKAVSANKSKWTFDNLIDDDDFKEFVEAKVPSGLPKTEKELDDLRDAFAAWLNENRTAIATDSNLRYHQDENGNYVPYIEIMLPASNFGLQRKRADGTLKTDKELLNELKNAGLDEIIGYRIPTEGKQSMSIMKVVGFTPDAMGSTIVVPDAWVAQTGADFDVDSIYGIHFESYVDSNGHIQKVEYKNEVNGYDWFSYVNRHMGGRIAGVSDDEFNEIKKKALAIAKSYRVELQKESSEAYRKLPKNIQEEIKKVHNAYRVYDESGNERDKTAQEYIAQLQAEIERCEELLNSETNDETKNAISEYKDVINDILVNITGGERESISAEISDRVKRLKAMQLAAYRKQAELYNLKGLEEWVADFNADPSKSNSRQARNNKILENMLTILRSAESLEENLSRSNFDDINDSLSKCIVGTQSLKRKARSPYDILDQADYQDDAMSGAKLKAFSVTRDTFCSVCNQLKPTLTDDAVIKVRYSKDYDYKKLKERFGEVEQLEDGSFVVTHRMFGWSKDNKNVEGKILTAYSSQTTAHILDAIKSGNVPNVNDLTFQVYKTFVDVGSNYDTAISFMVQPAIGRIVEAYNASKSIYAEEGGNNYVLAAVRGILSDLGIEYSNTQSLDDLLAIVTSSYGGLIGRVCGLNKVGAYSLTKDGILPVLSVDTQLDRLHERGIFGNDSKLKKIGNKEYTTDEIKAIYDLGIILQYHKINGLAQQIRDVTRITNPDKFGAKQTIYETSQVFDLAVESIETTEREDKNGHPYSVFKLQVDGQHILKAIYPGIEEGLESFINNPDAIKKSKYKSLAAFLKYATAASIQVNKTLFITQSENFVKLIIDDRLGIASRLSYGNRISPKIYKLAQDYIINHIALSSPFIANSLKYNVTRSKGHPVGFDYTSDNNKDRDTDEIARIFGYGHSPAITIEKKVNQEVVDEQGNTTTKEITVDSPVTVKNINKPTQEEVDDFAKLSPAQKVLFIKQNFRDAGIFEYINCNLYNEYRRKGKRAGMQELSFNENAINIESAYAMFYQAFTNRNPLVALAAADLIKYAFVVEGYRMGMNNISKCIKYDALVNDGPIYGTSIMSAMNDAMANIDDILLDFGYNGEEHNDGTRRKLIDNFIRSHAESVGINYRRVAKIKGSLELLKRADDVIQINATTDRGKELAAKYAITYTEADGVTSGVNSYVRLGIDGNTILYKIKVDDKASPRNYFLYPVNELEANEFGEWSANPDLNKYPSTDYYETLINNYISTMKAAKDASRDFNYAVYKEERDKISRKDYTAKKDSSRKQNYGIPIEDINNFEIGYLNDLNHRISEWYLSSPVKGSMKFIWMPSLSRHIIKPRPENGITDTIAIRNDKNEIVATPLLNIAKFDVSNLAKLYTGKNIDREVARSDMKYIEAINLLRDISRQFYKDQTIPSWFTDIYVVTEPEIEVEDDGFMESDMLDSFVSNSVASFTRRQEADPRADRIHRNFQESGITSKKENATMHMEEVIIATAKYARDTANDILAKLNAFIEDPDNPGTYLSVDKQKCIELVRQDPIRRREYAKAILEPRAFVEEYGLIKDLHISSEDENLRPYLKEIKDSVEKVQNSPLAAQAMKLWGKGYLDEVSDNPLVKSGIISVLDGFYKSNWLNTMFNDIQEQSNPIVQVTLKNFQTILRAKDMKARKEADEFEKQFDDIKAEALKAGARFDLSKIIDDYGRFKQPYTEKFLEDRDAYKKAVEDAAAQHGRYSVEHLKAKLAYDKWKAAYLEQPVVKEYYDKKNKIVEEALTEIPNLYSRYEQLRHKRAELRSKLLEDSENAHLDEEIEAITTELYNLKSIAILDPVNNKYVEKSEEPGAGEFNSKAAAQKLKETTNNLYYLESEYYRHDAVYNFEQELKKHLRIVDKHEANQTTDNEEYKQSKRWLARNVEEELVVDYRIKDKLEEAYEILGGSSVGSENLTIQLHAVTKNPAYRDEYGKLDPRKIPANIMAKIREEQAKRYGYKDENAMSDKVLLSNGNPRGEIYTREFYQKMSTSKVKGKKYQETVDEINSLLQPYYDSFSKKINIQAIPHTPEGLRIIKRLNELYDILDDERYSKKRPRTPKAVKTFIKNNVEFDIDEDSFNADITYANDIHDEFGAELRKMLQAYDFDGELEPNRFLYGYARPKGDRNSAKYKKFVDTKKQQALETLNRYTSRVKSDYYWQAWREAKARGKEEFDKWYKENHIYNPYSHTVEPISVWYNNTIIKGAKTEYRPAYPQTIRTVRDGHYNVHEITDDTYERLGLEDDLSITDDDIAEKYWEEVDYRNQNYDEDGGHAQNYRVGSNPEYDTQLDANEYELRAMRLMQDTIMRVSKTNSAKRRAKQGWIPARRQEAPSDAKGWLRETLKTMGWTSEKYTKDDWYEDVDYYRDRPNVMPLMEQLKGKGTKTMTKKYPKRTDFTGDNAEAEYQQALKEYNEERKEVTANNLEIHKKLLDKDYVGSIKEFIVRGATFNAVQESKYELFLAQSMLKKYGAYEQGFTKDGKIRFKKDVRGSSTEEAEYLKREDKNIVAQFDNQLRRILYDQYKAPSNPKLLKAMSTLQSITSAQYMMLNFKGGIANVTVGETSVMAEAFAANYFNTKQWGRSKVYYSYGLIDYILNAGKETSTTVQGAIIKFMDVVDYDEHTGVSRLTKDAYEVLKKIRDYAYTPQTAGEHAMQNGAMFAMMESHRLYPNENAAKLGQPKYIYKNLAEVTRDCHEKALEQVMTDEQKDKYKQAVENIKKDANLTKDLAWFALDITSEFAFAFLNREQQHEFIKKRNELEKKAKEEFEGKNNEGNDLHPTLLSQLVLGTNGKMAFKDGSLLQEIDIEKDNGEPSDALMLLASFKGRVISVNKKIHGVYDKSGRAQFEKTFIGSLVMQYHKHLPVGILKRYRIKGMFNEERGTVEKGMYKSIYDFLSIPFRNHKEALGFTDDEVDALESVQEQVKNICDFALHLRLAYNMIPEYDRANIKRLLASVVGTVNAMILVVGIKAGWDDEDSIPYNLALYELDRYATEIDQYFPPTFYTEGKKLWSSPIAAGSGITDLLSSTNMLCHMILEGDEFDGDYHSGRFAGENKLKVYVTRRIPMWRGVKSSFVDILDNNSYYKVGENFLGFFNVDAYAEKLK